MKTIKPSTILSFTLLVVMTGYSMVMPVMPFYIEKMGAGGRELGWPMASYSLMQLICAPAWGMLSDRIGRKPVLTIGVLGYAITLFLFGLANQLWMLFLARSLSGILSSATMPTAMAYIGDHATKEQPVKVWGSSARRWALAWWPVRYWADCFLPTLWRCPFLWAQAWRSLPFYW